MIRHRLKIQKEDTRILVAMVCTFLLSAVILVLPFSAGAWGFGQHRVIARIAEKHLTAEARAEVLAILGPNTTLSDVSVWADLIKESRPHTGPWHYINYPLELDEPNFDAMNTPRGNVFSAIETRIAILRDPRSDRELRGDALKFLVHLVGDIHQPLHCGILRDRGGNTIRVLWRGELSNLHAIWDSGLFPVEDSQVNRLTESLIEDISPEEREEIMEGEPYDWMVESHRLVRETCYPDQTNSAFQDSTRTPPQLSGEYIQRNRLVAERRVTEAGLRLAWLLNNILVAPSDLPSETPQPKVQF
jgi:nuclease S1